MAGAAEEGEVQAELDAVQAVYGDDCSVLRPFPPHVDVYLRPRTADDSSQQFVEAVLGIRAGSQKVKESFEVTASEDGDREVLQSDAENTRRQKFEDLLDLQRENSGLIEPKKDLVVVPGMYLPERVTRPAVSSGDIAECTEDGESNEMVAGNSNKTLRPPVNVQKHSSIRRGRDHNPRKHPNAQPSRKEWIKKDNGMD